MTGFESGRPWHRIATEALLGQSKRTNRLPSRVHSRGDADAVYLLYILASVPAFLVKAWAAGRLSFRSDTVTMTSSVADDLLAGLALILPLLFVAMLVSLAWAMIFARVRGRPVDPAWAMTAWVYVLLLPAELSAVFVALGMSFAAVLGQHAFGGSGRYLVSPALLGALFVYYSYPDAGGQSVVLTWQHSVNALSGGSVIDVLSLANRGPGSLVLPMLVACVVGAVPLIRTGVLSLRLIAGAALGAALTAPLIGLFSDSSIATLAWPWHLVLGGMPICLVFVISDPTAQALTRGGRWSHGFLFVSIAVTVRLLDPAHPDATFFAALLATLAVPLVDYMVCRRNATRSGGRLQLRS